MLLPKNLEISRRQLFQLPFIPSVARERLIMPAKLTTMMEAYAGRYDGEHSFASSQEVAESDAEFKKTIVALLQSEALRALMMNNPHASVDEIFHEVEIVADELWKED